MELGNAEWRGRARRPSNFPKEKPGDFSICTTALPECPEPRGMVAPSQSRWWGQGTVCLFPLGSSRARQRSAVPFVLLALLEDWDRILLPPRAPPQPVLLLLGSRGASCANSLPLGLLGHEGGRGSGCFPQLRQEPPSQTPPWEKDPAPKSSAGCLCEYPPPPLSFPGEDLGCAGGRGEEQGGTRRRRPQTPNPPGHGMLWSRGFGRSPPLSAPQ